MRRMLFILISLIPFYSCSDESVAPDSKNVIVFIDPSVSTDTAVFKSYIVVSRAILSSSLGQDKLSFYFIDAATEKGATPIFQINFSKEKHGDTVGKNNEETIRLRELVFTRFIDKKYDELKDAISKEKKNRDIAKMNSNILGCFKVSNDLFDSSFNNYLIVLSDCEQDDPYLKMTPGVTAKNWIDAVKIDTLSNLKRFASIDILTGAELRKTQQYCTEIKTFWQNFFLLQGVKQYSYSAGNLDGVLNKLKK